MTSDSPFSIRFADSEPLLCPQVCVVGVGEAGGCALSHMLEQGLEIATSVCVSTDSRALASSWAKTHVILAADTPRGSGVSPAHAERMALDQRLELSEALEGMDLVFVVAGLGGATGTGVAPVVAELARDQGALAVCVVTLPFDFEGRRRSDLAVRGVSACEAASDTVICISNDRLADHAEDLPARDAYRLADLAMHDAIHGMVELLRGGGLLNVDFSDLATILRGAGRAFIGRGRATGEHRAFQATEQALTSGLLSHASPDGARAALVHVTAGPSLRLSEVRRVKAWAAEQTHEDANIIIGARAEDHLEESLEVLVIATGLEATGTSVRAATLTPKSRVEMLRSESGTREARIPGSDHVLVRRGGSEPPSSASLALRFAGDGE